MQRRIIIVVAFLTFCFLYPGVTPQPMNSTAIDTTPTKSNILGDGESNPFEVTWWSRDNQGPVELQDNDIVDGDRIEVLATFPNSTENPEDNIVNIQWSASSGFIESRNGTLLIPDDGYEPFIQGLQLDQLVWERFDGIQIGNNVRLTLFHNNSDTDALVYWADQDNQTWYTDAGLTARQMATQALPETGSFVANRAGSIVVGIYCYDYQPGHYNLIVDTTDEANGKVDGNTVVCETWQWEKNVTLSFDFTATTDMGQLIKQSLNNVTFNNFFAPQISTVDIVADGALRYISWSTTDRNLFETHHYEIRLSIDGGYTYLLLSTGFTRNSYVWNTAGFDDYEVCRIQITAIDSVGLSSSAVSSIFSIGANADFTGSFWYATTASGNSSYIWGSNDNKVSWQVWIENYNPMEYEVFIDGEIIRTGWTNGEEISVDADGLSIGLHMFTLALISDAERRNDTVYVEVLPDPHEVVLQSFSSGSAGVLIVAILFLAELSRRYRRR